METKMEICTGEVVREENTKDEGQAITSSRYLDNYMLINIFSRIPADVLGNNFMYQCKQWYRVISDQDLINLNFRHHSKQGIVFMEETEDNSESRFVMKFMELEGLKVVEVREVHEFKNNLSIKSSCNGLLLVTERNLYHVMNPATKKSITLPSKIVGKTLWSALVFLPSVMEYRVVEFSFCRDSNENSGHILHIQTLNGGTKHYNLMEIYEIYDKGHVSINGVLYWDAGKENNHLSSIDLCTETFQRLDRPSSSPSEQSYDRHLINLSGSLAVVDFVVDYSQSTPNLVNLWTLISGEWEKVFSINRLQIRIEGKEYCPIGFVCATNDGNVCIFQNYHKDLGAYDIKTKQWTFLEDSNYQLKENQWYSGHTAHLNSLFTFDHKPEENNSTCAF